MPCLSQPYRSLCVHRQSSFLCCFLKVCYQNSLADLTATSLGSPSLQSIRYTVCGPLGLQTSLRKWPQIYINDNNNSHIQFSVCSYPYVCDDVSFSIVIKTLVISTPTLQRELKVEQQAGLFISAFQTDFKLLCLQLSDINL